MTDKILKLGIPAGSLGIVSGTSIPERSVILNQGGKTLVTSGTSLTQPLTELLKIKPANDMAAAELSASRDRAHSPYAADTELRRHARDALSGARPMGDTADHDRAGLLRPLELALCDRRHWRDRIGIA